MDAREGSFTAAALDDGGQVERRFRIATRTAKARRQARSLTTTTGGGAVGTFVVDEEGFIQAARSRSIAGLLGARFASYAGGRSPVALPRISAGAHASWLAEGDAPPPTSGAGGIDRVALEPKFVSAYTVVTRSMAASAGPGLDAVVLADLAGALGAAIDAAAFAGPGGDAPLGLLNHPDVPVLALGPDGAEPTRGPLLSALKTVGQANGLAQATASPGWATSIDGEAKLRAVDGSSGGAGRWLWDADRVLDRPAFSTSALPNDLVKGSGVGLSPLIFGDFDALLINLPDEFDLLVDPFSANPDVVFVAYLEAAVAVRRAASFVKILDMKTAG